MYSSWVGLQLLPCWGWGHRMVSTAGMTYWLGAQIRQNGQLSSLAIQALELALWMGRDTG